MGLIVIQSEVGVKLAKEKVMQKIWDFPIREDIRKEFPNDPMMQELHELRARFPFSRKTDDRKVRARRENEGNTQTT